MPKTPRKVVGILSYQYAAKHRLEGAETLRVQGKLLPDYITVNRYKEVTAHHRYLWKEVGYWRGLNARQRSIYMDWITGIKAARRIKSQEDKEFAQDLIDSYEIDLWATPYHRPREGDEYTTDWISCQSPKTLVEIIKRLN